MCSFAITDIIGHSSPSAVPTSTFVNDDLLHEGAFRWSSLCCLSDATSISEAFCTDIPSNVLVCSSIDEQSCVVGQATCSVIASVSRRVFPGEYSPLAIVENDIRVAMTEVIEVMVFG